MPSISHEAFEFVKESGGIREYTLRSNGLQVLLLPEAAAPVATFMVTYRVGSRNEVNGLTGATHLLEHLMFKGTERFNKAAGTSIFNTLQNVGARLNATTWLDRTNYYELLPKEHLPLAIEIEADRMRGALVSEDDLASERTVVLNEFDRGENEPVRKLMHAVWGSAFVAHPYHHPTIGWRSDIENVTAEGLRHFYDTYYWPNNATATVIGDFDEQAALDLLARYFGAIGASPAPIPDVTTREPEQRGERRVTVHQAGQLGSIVMGWKTATGLNVDADALDVLGIVLGSGKNARLYRNLTDTGLTTAVFTSNYRLRDPGLFLLYAGLAPGTTHTEAEAAIDETISALRKDGITRAELERAKNLIRAQAAFERDGPYLVAAQLNEAIAAGDWTLYTEYFDRIERVNLDAVQQAAEAYLVSARRTVGWFEPESIPA